jgi:hypothetical protein
VEHDVSRDPQQRAGKYCWQASQRMQGAPPKQAAVIASR